MILLMCLHSSVPSKDFTKKYVDALLHEVSGNSLNEDASEDDLENRYCLKHPVAGRVRQLTRVVLNIVVR